MLFTGELTQRQLAKRLKEKTQEELLEMERFLVGALKENVSNSRSGSSRLSCSERFGSRNFGGEQGREFDYYRKVLCAVKTEISRRAAEKEMGA